MDLESLRAMENVLVGLPGVHRATVVVRKSAAGEPRSVAYVVPEDRYLEQTFSDQDQEVRRTEQWRKIYDLYQKPQADKSVESGLSARVWRSTYTNQPIPEQEMQEWIGCTIDRVRQLNSTKVLEIGCGLGALLLPLGPHCERYVGTDISGASIASLKRHIESSPGKWSSVELFERAADNFNDFDDGTFDKVIINSVTMYFPSAEYLTRVLEGAIRMALPNGTIFVGDIHSLPLRTTFAVSVELFQAQSGMSLDELRDRVRKRLRLEKELCISPSFFIALQESHPEISHVEIRPKRGRFDNEMNRFRYDVVLRLGSSTKACIEPLWQSWCHNKLTFELLRERLCHQAPELLAFAGIKNARIEKDNLALESLMAKDAFPGVTELKEAVKNVTLDGVHPEKLFSLAAECGYQMDFSWASCRSDGSYDVIFYRIDQSTLESRPTFTWPRPVSVSHNLAHYVAGPVWIDHRRKWVRHLRDSLTAKLGEHCIPADFVVLDAMPITSGGDIDHAVLPPPWLSGM